MNGSTDEGMALERIRRYGDLDQVEFQFGTIYNATILSIMATFIS
jgi:hypothetical protein